jgi:hypothetical protein
LGGVLDQLENRLLDAGAQVVRTRVEDERFWIALLKANAIVLVASHTTSNASLGTLDPSQSKVVWEHVPQSEERVEELVSNILTKSTGREQ